MMAIETLHQLSSHFLRENTDDFSDTNQYEFLSPFAVLLSDVKNSEKSEQMKGFFCWKILFFLHIYLLTRTEVIIEGLGGIARTYSRKLKSGWKIIFNSLASLAKPPISKKLANISFSCLIRIIEESFDIFQANLPLFFNIQEALLQFSLIGSLEITLAEKVTFSSLLFCQTFTPKGDLETTRD